MLATDYFVDDSCFCVKGCFLNFIVRDKYRYFNSPILKRLNPFNDEYLHSVMNSPNSNYESIIFKRKKRLALRRSLFFENNTKSRKRLSRSCFFILRWWLSIILLLRIIINFTVDRNMM